MKAASDTQDLVAQFLAGGGEITRCPPKAASGNDGKEFTHTRQTIKDNKRR